VIQCNNQIIEIFPENNTNPMYYLNISRIPFKLFQTVLYAFAFLVIDCGLSLKAHAAGLPAVKDFRIEAKDAQSRQVPILVLFMSDSCPYCEIVLEDFLLPMQRDPAFKDKVILRQIETSSHAKMIDFDGNITTQNGFASKRKVMGVPQVYLFDSNGKVLTSIVGLLTQDFYYAYLDDAINSSLARIRENAK
jgi:thioredoxin-related protein